MSRKKRKNKNGRREEFKKSIFSLIPEEIKRLIIAAVFFLAATVIALSFFNLAGIVGKWTEAFFNFFWGKAKYAFPFLCVLTAFSYLRTRYKKIFFPVFLASLFISIGISGFLGMLSLKNQEAPEITKIQGGLLGYILAFSLFKLFGFLVGQIVFSAMIIVGFLVLRQLMQQEKTSQKLEIKEDFPASQSIVKRITSNFKIKKVEPSSSERQEKVEIKVLNPKLQTKPLEGVIMTNLSQYKFPPLSLLEPDKENPSSGDTRLSSAIIKKTLQNFDISVEMSEINVGPTVTQYTLKPAEGIKLTKITTLDNNLSLSLAAHPIRIEAPIPGRSLVGIEVPNKVRARVRLRNLIEHPNYQNSPASLLIALGKDVSGLPFYADLARMPHLLVAGSTGTGKTIFLNSLILSLLYKNSPETLRIILIDPKKVEFMVYQDLPHLLAPVICDPVSACNALRWLIGEMERRFDVLSVFKARDISSYNETVRERNARKQQAKGKKEIIEDSAEEPQILPYIVLVVDELADLMAAKGRDIEAAVVRLAQMARAVGIHLVLATQRPSVEVITGLIKANVTSRITFQVPSQIDSRTIIDASGAEKLIGMGDMLFISGEISKPKRIQGAFASEKEVRKVADFIKLQAPEIKEDEVEEEAPVFESPDTNLPSVYYSMSLEKALQAPPDIEKRPQSGNDEPLYEEAKKIVIESKKASASLLQRRLRVGYARAARLIDLLEDRGVVGPGEGAKPREVYGLGEVVENDDFTEEEEIDEVAETAKEETITENSTNSQEESIEDRSEEDDDWRKV
ncbi:MAG: DNA translocase FtsK 4TM domain-containing protein [bacterium]